MTIVKAVNCVASCLMFINLAASDDTNWNHFASSKSYENTKLVLNTYNPFQPDYISKENSLILARMECARKCSLQVECYSFNFYETDAFYVCELLVDNFCARRGRLALQLWPGGSVWDKLSSGMSKTCIEQSFQGINKVDYCEKVSPGCNGTWPHCTDCVQSCKDCFANRSYSSGGFHDCTLWPEGHFVVPIFSTCFGSATFIIMRRIDATTGNSQQLYFMSLFDMNRLSNLNVYHSMELYFTDTTGGSFFGSYYITDIDINGKLGNVSLKYGQDGFGLNGKTASLDFVNVWPDPDHCGSFWLLNPSNSMSCPGGQVSVFGSPKLQNGQLLATGIHWPPSSGQIISYVDIKLAL